MPEKYTGRCSTEMARGDFINEANIRTSSYSYVESEEFLTGKEEEYLYFWSPHFSIRGYCNAKPNWFAPDVGFSFDVNFYDGNSWNNWLSRSLSAGNSSANGNWEFHVLGPLIEVYAKNTGGYNGRNHIWLTLGGLGNYLYNYDSDSSIYNNDVKGKPIRANGSGAIDVYSSLTQARDSAISYFNTNKMRGTLITSSLVDILRTK